MLHELHLLNFPHGEEIEPHLQSFSHAPFVLRTCQRTLVLSYGQLPEQIFHQESHRFFVKGEEAYRFLLETICGLKSQLLGENEIVSQFKDAYRPYIQKPQRHPHLIRILEKLFQDAKEIRSQYLVGLGQKTYAGIARKKLSHAGAKEVLILGSGALAEDLINQLKKKNRLFISGRNTKKVEYLAREHHLAIIPWGDHHDRSSLLKDFPFIVNTIGTHEILLEQKSFFTPWSIQHGERKTFIDLGAPSCIESSFGLDENVFRLNDILGLGAIEEDKKIQQIQLAKNKLLEVTKKRSHHLSLIQNSKPSGTPRDVKVG